MYPIPLPSDHVDSARKLGLTYADTSNDQLWLEAVSGGARDGQAHDGLSMMHGIVWFPHIENAWADNRLDNGTVKGIRESIASDFTLALSKLKELDDKQFKASRDNRYSQDGRFGMMKATFLDWYNSEFLRRLLTTIPSRYEKLTKDLDRCVTPPKLASDATAAAIASSCFTTSNPSPG
jgi:hypothetical protein